MDAIPRRSQLDALVGGNVIALIREHHGTDPVDFRKCLTVSRADLERYLQELPEVAKGYLESHRGVASESYDDVHCLEQTPDGFLVFALDHGRRWDIRQFTSLVPAVAEYVLRRHGMASR